MIFFKDPDAEHIDFTVDWAAWLDTDTIATSEWIVPDGITKDSDTSTETTATVYLDGGTAGSVYPVTNRITTAGGRTNDQTMQIRVANR